MEERRFVTTAQVARHAGVSPDGVLKWIRAGMLRAFATPGGHYRISIEDFDEFLTRYNMPAYEGSFSQKEVRRPTVLLISSDEELCLAIKQLSGEEMRTERAFLGFPAALRVASLRPRLVILDVADAQRESVSLCYAVSNAPETQRAKIIAVMTFPGQESREALRAAGAHLCLEKPLNLVQLGLEMGRLLKVPLLDPAPREQTSSPQVIAGTGQISA